MNTLFWSVSTLIQFILASPFNVKQDAFTLPKIGRRLKGTELKTMQAKSNFFCANDCLRLDNCTAFNYDGINGTCELIEADDLYDTEPDPNYEIVYKKITCDKQPCLHGGTCYDLGTMVHDIKGYRCSCLCGRCGSRCERIHFGDVIDACIDHYNAGYKKVDSPDECMAFCWDTQGCRSADYIAKDEACWLNSVTNEEEELTYDCNEIYPGIAYLFFNCTCDE